jgi:DNA-binding transcriptional ArsR family regulator
MSPGSAPTLAKAAPVFAALGDETRLSIVARLAAGGPLSITTLTDGTGITRQAVTKHLDVLASSGLVHGSRHGRERIWELDTGQLSEAQRYLELMSERWDDRLERLARQLASDD